jgi:N-acetylmuramic acid 6-phosphate etherase
MAQSTGSRDDLDALLTEAHDAAGADLDLRSTLELVELMNAADAVVPGAVAAAAPAISAAIDAIAGRVGDKGRLIYVGAGTSGRLAALDAAECGPTFSTDRVVAVLTESEADEDDEQAAAEELDAIGLSTEDAVIGISASGRTPFVLGALEHARKVGALTVCLVCVPDSELARVATHEIAVPVGAEVLSGSTRLKAGTAQKLVLNMLSTITMVRLGKTYGNLMVDVVPSNEKLRARVRRVVASATGAAPEQVDEALASADGNAKVAIVALLAGVDAGTARARLAAANDDVHRAVDG